MSSNKVNQAREEFRRMKAAFRARTLLDARFYAQLEAAGCEIDGCALVSFFPDGSDTFVGKLIRQDGRIVVFDLALTNPAASEWEDHTNEFLQEYELARKSQPWSAAVVAYEDFLRESQGKDQAF